MAWLAVDEADVQFIHSNKFDAIYIRHTGRRVCEYEMYEASANAIN